MDIGVVIKKYRKEAGMTQEEMANRLGVTTPAVNKWENSNSKPDIELLAPIARLLDISLDTSLSFHEKLSDTEIEEIIRKMDKMFSEEGYEKTYEWALRLIKEYPNCNMLIWQAAPMLDIVCAGKDVEGTYKVVKYLLEDFRNEEEFGYMAGYEPWEKLIFDR
jgi:transcriptional regulator with XRE-family HTH domain